MSIIDNAVRENMIAVRINTLIEKQNIAETAMDDLANRLQYVSHPYDVTSETKNTNDAPRAPHSDLLNRLDAAIDLEDALIETIRKVADKLEI